MNSPLEIREVRLRGLLQHDTADVHQRMVLGPGTCTRSVEALFAERVSARQGLSQSQRRVYPLRLGDGHSPRGSAVPHTADAPRVLKSFPHASRP
jgi:hypothetical protein